MEIGPEFLVALAGVLTAILTGGLAWYNARHTARKDLVDILQEEIERLTKRIVVLEEQKIERDEQYDALLKRVFDLERDNATLKQKIITLEAENARLTTQNKELQKKVKAMEQSLKDMEASE